MEGKRMKEWLEYLSGGAAIMGIILIAHIIPGALYTFIIGGIL
jgi:hypothetical protein